MASSLCGRTWYRGILPVGPTSLTSGEQKPPRPLISSTSLPHSHSLPPNIIHIIHIIHIVYLPPSFSRPTITIVIATIVGPIKRFVDMEVLVTQIDSNACPIEPQVGSLNIN